MKTNLKLPIESVNLTNLRFVAEQINDHLRRQETNSDVAESEQRNCRTADI
ncbi:hypothetical protein Scep_000842 [Stephania cephalantha]|uniref:Uncharacterized protein n=1 Tax=Stephania cephalantha TaxID=152367 RepID=A0AAP0L717_9MAGN